MERWLCHSITNKRLGYVAYLQSYPSWRFYENKYKKKNISCELENWFKKDNEEKDNYNTYYPRYIVFFARRSIVYQSKRPKYGAA
jgi:hypothetical protein